MVADGLRRDRGPRTADSRPTEIGVRRIAITPPSSGGGFAFGRVSSTGRGRECRKPRAVHPIVCVAKSATGRFYARHIPINGRGLGSYHPVWTTGRSGLQELYETRVCTKCASVQKRLKNESFDDVRR